MAAPLSEFLNLSGKLLNIPGPSVTKMEKMPAFPLVYGVFRPAFAERPEREVLWDSPKRMDSKQIDLADSMRSSGRDSGAREVVNVSRGEKRESQS